MRHPRPAAIVPTCDLQACQALEAHSASRPGEFKRLADGEGETDEDGAVWDEVTDRYGPW